MARKVIFVMMIAAVCAAIAGAGLAAETAKKQAAAKQAPAMPQAARAVQKPNFNMITGTVVKVDSSDPANVRLQVKDDKDGKTVEYQVLQWTNITKIIDASELKAGETVRVMSRKTGEKEVAMGIMSGKIKAPPKQPSPVEAVKAQAKK